MVKTIVNEFKRKNQYSKRMASIVDGYSDEKLQKALTAYITDFKFSKMTN